MVLFNVFFANFKIGRQAPIEREAVVLQKSARNGIRGVPFVAKFQRFESSPGLHFKIASSLTVRPLTSNFINYTELYFFRVERKVDQRVFVANIIDVDDSQKRAQAVQCNVFHFFL